MQLTTIGCSGTFEVGRPAFKKYWLEAELEENDVEQDCMDKLNEKIEGYNEKYSPDEKKKITIPSVPLSDETQALFDGIKKCTQIEGDTEFSLNTFWLRAKGNLATSNAYKDKEKQLKDAK